MLTGDIFRIKSCATTSKSRSLATFFWNSATSPGCSTSNWSAASRTASIQLRQEHKAGIPGATAALTPVPITSKSSRGCLRIRLFKNFLASRSQTNSVLVIINKAIFIYLMGLSKIIRFRSTETRCL